MWYIWFVYFVTLWNVRHCVFVLMFILSWNTPFLTWSIWIQLKNITSYTSICVWSNLSNRQYLHWPLVQIALLISILTFYFIWKSNAKQNCWLLDSLVVSTTNAIFLDWISAEKPKMICHFPDSSYRVLSSRETSNRLISRRNEIFFVVGWKIGEFKSAAHISWSKWIVVDNSP